jgi:hypothetical protein
VVETPFFFLLEDVPAGVDDVVAPEGRTSCCKDVQGAVSLAPFSSLSFEDLNCNTKRSLSSDKDFSMLETRLSVAAAF